MKASAIGILVIFFICSIIGAVLWPYSINTWLAFFDKPQTVLWWHGALLGFCPVLGQVTIPVAVVTFILMLFL